MGERFNLPIFSTNLKCCHFERIGGKQLYVNLGCISYYLSNSYSPERRTLNLPHFQQKGNTSNSNGGKSPASHSLTFAGGYLGSGRTKLKSISVPSTRSRKSLPGAIFCQSKHDFVKSNFWGVMTSKSTSKTNRLTITSRVYSMLRFLTRIMEVKKRPFQ